MTGLIATPAPPPEAPNAAVVADAWFPPVKLSAVRDAVRIGDGTVTTERLTAAIEGAMVHAFRELAVWRAAQVLAGHATLVTVTGLTVNGRNMGEVLWERVVRYFAAAELASGYRDVSATDAALDRAQDKDIASDEYRRLALAAVADLRSLNGEAVGRNRVALL